RRALTVAGGHAKEIVGVAIAEACVVAGRRGLVAHDGVIALDLEEKKLVEALAMDVGAELHGVVADDLGVVIHPLEGVADLRQFPFEVVADGKPSGNVDIRDALSSRDRGGNAETGAIGSDLVVQILEAFLSGNEGAAGGMHAARKNAQRMIEVALALPEV